jgi:hypothetical protein
MQGEQAQAKVEIRRADGLYFEQLIFLPRASIEY